MGTPMAPTSDCNGKVYYTPPVKSHCSPGGVTSSQTIFHLTWNALECRSHNLVANSTLWPPHPDEISASKISNGDISLSRHPGGLRKATGNEPRWNYVTIALFFYCLSPVTEISPKRVSFESAPTLFFCGTSWDRARHEEILKSGAEVLPLLLLSLCPNWHLCWRCILIGQECIPIALITPPCIIPPSSRLFSLIHCPSLSSL